MVFGNTFNVTDLKSKIPQTGIYAMRVPRAIPLAEVTRRSGLPAEEVRRFNPALNRQVPSSATLYLPAYISDFGPDVSFWHNAPSPAFASVLEEFVRIDAPLEQWDDPQFEIVLRDFQQRFKATQTEEGRVMDTVLAYVIDESRLSRRGPILDEFRTSTRIQSRFERGLSQLENRHNSR
jgi:hypothetical protein